MEAYAQVAEAIIQKLHLVLQEMAFEHARKVSGIELDATGHVRSVAGGSSALESLVKEYQELLGPAAISFAHDAALPLIKQHPELALPQVLR